MNLADLEGLVISVNPNNQTAKCYSEQLGCLINVKLPTNIRVGKGTYVVLTDFDFCGDVYVPTAKTFKTRKSTKVRFHAGEMLIEALAACSNNEKHSTYGMQVAYSEGFGHVRKSGLQMQRGVVFYVDLALNDSDEQTLFRIVNVKKRVDGQLSKKLIEAMTEFEERQPKWEQWPEGTDDSEIELSADDTNPETEEVLDSETSITSYRPEASACQRSSSRSIESLPSTSTSRCTMMSAQLKPDTELHCLVLNVGEYVVGFEMAQLKLVRIKIDNPEIRIRKYETINFIVGDNRDGIVHVKPGTLMRRTDNEHSDGQMTARVAFSPNPNHASYNCSVAVSDRYGYIKLPGNYDARFAKSTIYTVEIVLNQFEDPLAPVFQATSVLTEVGTSSDTNDVFFDTINKFEERMFKETRENGLGSTQIPQFPNNTKPRRIVNRAAGKSDLDSLLTCPALVLSLYQQRGGNFGEVWTCRGDMLLRCIPQTATGECVRRGDWVSVRVEKNNRNPTLRVNKILCKEDIQPPVEFVGDIPIVTQEFNFSLMKKERDGIRYYDQGVLGLVETHPNIYQNPKTSTIVDFYKIERPYSVDGANIYWIAKEHDPRRDTHRMNSVPINGERFNSSANDAHFPDYRNDGSPQFPQEANHRYPNNHPPNAKYIPHHESDNQPRNEYPSNEQYAMPQNFTGPPMQHPPTPMSSVSYSTQPNVFRGTGIAVNYTGNVMLVFLIEKECAARMIWEEMEGRSVAIGGVFECEYKQITPIDHVEFEITKVVKLTYTKHTCRQIHDECQLLVTVNMCAYPADMNCHLKIGASQVVVGDFGHVILAKQVINPRGENMKDRDIIKLYEGEEQAQNLVGWCRFVLAEVQERGRVANGPCPPLVLKYVWEVVELVSTSDQFQIREKQIAKDNLGASAGEYEHDDDVARQKRINKANEMAEAMRGNSDYPPSFDQNNRGINSSQSFHTANDGTRPPSSFNEQPFGYSRNSDSNGPMRAQPSQSGGFYSNAPSTSNFYQQSNNAPHVDERDVLIDQLQSLLRRSITAHYRMGEQIFEFSKSAQGINCDQLIDAANRNDQLVREYHHFSQSSNFRR